MKIIVTVKPVPDVQLKIHTAEGSIVTEGINTVINAWDENALEEAIRIKESKDAEVVLLTIDKPGADKIIRKALAFGADRAVHVEFDSAGADALTVGALLAAVIKKESPDLVLCGKQAQDTDRGQCALIASYKANMPAAANVSSLKINGNDLELERLGEEGTELIEMSMPAMVTVSDSINEPRLANIKNIMAARKKTIDLFKPDDLGVTVPHAYSVTPSVFTNLPAKDGGKIIQGEVSQAASEAARLLMNEAKAF